MIIYSLVAARGVWRRESLATATRSLTQLRKFIYVAGQYLFVCRIEILVSGRPVFQSSLTFFCPFTCRRGFFVCEFIHGV